MLWFLVLHQPRHAAESEANHGVPCSYTVILNLRLMWTLACTWPSEMRVPTGGAPAG